MEFCGVISEFNPFHYGHQYIINEAKKQTGLPVLCLMSGDFVQRGDAAICDKFERAATAIKCGANAVLELPTIFACSNAENFATGAIKILMSLDIKTIAFGIENTTLEILEKIAELKYNNSIEFQNCFKNEIENGINYNTALKRSIAKCIKVKDAENILSSANNILAIEYLTAIKKLGAKINAVAVNRTDNGYFSDTAKGKFLGASAIRDLILSNKCAKEYLPKQARFTSYFTEQKQNTLNTLQLLKIRQTPASELEKCYDYSEGIEYRIKKLTDINENLENAINNIVTPRYRLPRVKKLLLYPLLDITKEIEKLAMNTKPAVKVLAISKQNKVLLNSYNKRKITLLACNNDYKNLSKNQSKIYDVTFNASEIYRSITGRKFNDKKIGTLFI